MLPVFGTAAILVAAPAPLLSTGYVAGNTLAAQHFNWYLYHLTKELNNLLISVGIGQLVTDDTQLTQAVGLNQVSISASGTTVASAFKGDTWTKFNNSGGASTYDISAGASRSGVRLTIEETNSNGVTIKTGTGMTAALGIGAVHLLWDGTQWCKVGGANIVQVFTSGSGATWKTPWAGSYKVTVVGGGAAGGGSPNWIGGGGGAGGTAIKTLFESQGATLTYTVGALVAGGSGAGTNGNASSLGDGTVTITGNGGIGGGASGVGVQIIAGGAGGSASNGDINITGQSGTTGVAITATGLAPTPTLCSGKGGESQFGRGGISVITTAAAAGVGGSGYGSGGSGATGATSQSGGAGAVGLVMIEF